MALRLTPRTELPWVAAGPTFSIQPMEGQLLLLPSWLEDQVDPFLCRGERISIAFTAKNAPDQDAPGPQEIGTPP